MASGIDVDEAVGRPVVAPAPDDAPVSDEPFLDVDVFEPGPDLDGAPPLGVLRAARGQPAGAVQLPHLAADFAGTGRARLGQVDDLLDFGIGLGDRAPSQ
jgi:hypothetical protein